MRILRCLAYFSRGSATRSSTCFAVCHPVVSSFVYSNVSNFVILDLYGRMSSTDRSSRRRSVWTMSSQSFSKMRDETDVSFQLPGETDPKDEVKHFRDSDDILKALGNPGRFQVIQFILLCGQFIPLAMTDMMSIFFSLSPTGLRIFAPDTKGNLTMAEVTAWNKEEVKFVSDFRTATSCEAYNLTNLKENQVTYVYQNQWQWSIIADMNLICGRTWMISFATTVYFLGQIVSSPVSGWIADKYGRRPLLLVSNLLFTLLSIGLVFSRDYLSFAILRFLIGLVRQAMNSSFYVLMMEWIPPQRRMTWAAIAQFPFSFGVLSLGLAAYLLQNWQHIQIVVALSNFLALGYIWFAPESLKWLLGENRVEEVEDISKRICKFNGTVLHPSAFDEIRSLAARLAVEKCWNFSGLTPTLRRSYSVLDCFRTFHVRNFTLLCSFIWMAILVQYFGLLLLLSQITGDIYANYAISGALELIPRAVGLLLTFRLDNRTTLMSYFLVSGSLAIVAGLVPEHNHAEAVTKTIVAFISRMSIVGTFALAYTFTSELFPTVIRNSGFGLCSIAMRVGSMIAPQIATLGVLSSFKGLPFLIMGTITVLAALCTFLLPETKDTKLLSTIEEAEAFGEANSPLRRLRSLWVSIRYRPNKNDPSLSRDSPMTVPEIIITFHDVDEALTGNAEHMGSQSLESIQDHGSTRDLVRSISSTQELTVERRASLLSQRRFSMV